MSRSAPRQGFLVRWFAPLLVGATLSGGGLLYLWQGAERDGLVDARPTMLDFGGTRLASGTRGGLSADAPVPAEVRSGAAVNDPLLVGTSSPTPAAPALPASPPPADFEAVFPRVTVLDAARFRVLRAGGPLVVHLGGITGVAFSEACDGTAGRWNCGARARADLARLIGPRSVGCVGLRVSEDDGESRADCWVGPRNLSVFMVSRGWAEPIDPADRLLAPYAMKAKAEKLGRYSDGALSNASDDAE